MFNGKSRRSWNVRAEWHDYTAPGFYMTTFLKSEEAPRFSEIGGYYDSSGIRANVLLSTVGKIVHSNIKSLTKKFDFVKMPRQVVMPDHLHLLLYVTRNEGVHLGEIVRVFKQGCTDDYCAAFPDSPIALNSGSLFQAGYNDRISLNRKQLDALKAYIDDNPRRYYIRKMNPDCFVRVKSIRIGDEEYEIFGNPFILSDPFKSNVRFSRRFTPEQLRRRKLEWLEMIRTDGVLVSPFIHEQEKNVYKYALENGGKIIRICENGFGERFKPMGAEFDLCAEGRLLLVAPKIWKKRKTILTRERCMQLNALAERIVATDFRR